MTGTRRTAETAPPELIELPGLALVRVRQPHARALAEAVAASLERLREWMPWANEEAASTEGQRARLAESEAEWDAGTKFEYVLFDETRRRVLGVLGVHVREDAVPMLGYWSHSEHAGRGNITAAARALTEAVLALPGVTGVEIHCDAGNHASAAIPRKLGYRLLRTEEREPQTAAETGRHLIWLRP